MRLRHIPGAEEAIASSPYVIQQPAEYFQAEYLRALICGK